MSAGVYRGRLPIIRYGIKPSARRRSMVRPDTPRYLATSASS